MYISTMVDKSFILFNKNAQCGYGHGVMCVM